MTRRPYDRPMPRASWYLHQSRYRSYMLRETTCLVVAAYCALLLAALLALASGDPARWAGFIASQRHPAWTVFHAAALVFFWAYQSAPWFRLAPRAIALSPRRFPATPRLIVAGHYLACLAVSGLVLWLAGVF